MQIFGFYIPLSSSDILLLISIAILLVAVGVFAGILARKVSKIQTEMTVLSTSISNMPMRVIHVPQPQTVEAAVSVPSQIQSQPQPQTTTSEIQNISQDTEVLLKKKQEVYDFHQTVAEQIDALSTKLQDLKNRMDSPIPAPVPSPPVPVDPLPIDPPAKKPEVPKKKEKKAKEKKARVLDAPEIGFQHANDEEKPKNKEEKPEPEDALHEKTPSISPEVMMRINEKLAQENQRRREAL